MKSKKRKPLYQQVLHLLPELTYVDVGARATKGNRLIGSFTQARYIGFELDAEECDRLNALNIDRHQFHPQAIGGGRETRTLYVTRNPACNSLYEPDVRAMHRFMECGPYFDVLEKKSIETISLVEWCQNCSIPGVDFLELDAQGSALDIIKGCKHLLTTSILGMQVEVEFFPIYKNQPLFSDIHNYLRPLDFLLFDLSRYRLRRGYLKTRGQLMWGHAFYLKDVHQMKDRQSPQLLALAAIASYYGFEDYALEVLEALLMRESHLEPFDHFKEIQQIRDSYSDRFEHASQKGILRLWKKHSTWRVAARKDSGYLIKD